MVQRFPNGASPPRVTLGNTYFLRGPSREPLLLRRGDRAARRARSPTRCRPDPDRGHERRGRAHRSSPHPLAGDGEPAAPHGRHRASPDRLPRRPRRQRLDPGQVQGVRPRRPPRAVELRRHVDARADVDGADRAGAAGILLDAGKEQDLLNMSGSPTRVLPLPQVVVAHEEYALFDRLLAAGATPRLEANIQNTLNMKDSVPQWNTVAELRGSEHPGQVVIVGAHLDSWDLGTGATDNGTGSIATLEAARIIAQSGLKPKRTIRFILFTGEEQGLIGSRKYAEAHAAQADSVQAVIVLDNGAGAITGMALQGHLEAYALWRTLLAPVHRLNADTITDAVKGGTDHLSFIPYGVPGFNFNQLTRGYNHTHHSQSDTYDKAIAADLMQGSAVIAVSAFELANLPELLARWEKRLPVQPIVAATVSPELLRSH